MKKKIAIISSTYLPSIGGSQIGLHVIIKGLVSIGYKPILFIPFKTYLKLKKKKVEFKLFGNTIASKII